MRSRPTCLMDVRLGAVRRLAGRVLVVGLIAMSAVGCDDVDQQPSSSQSGSTVERPVASQEDDASHAEAFCRAALPHGYDFLSARPTTVGEVRALPGGPQTSTPGRGLLADAFPGVASDEFAAWCWGHDAEHGAFLSLVAGPGGSVHTIGSLRSEEAPPPGPPMFE